MDNLLSDLSDQEREGLARAMDALRDAGFTPVLTKMYQSEAQLAIMIVRNVSSGSMPGDPE